VATTKRTTRSASVNGAKTSRTIAKSATKSQSMPEAKNSQNGQMSTEKLAQRILAGVKKYYGVNLATRQSRIKRKVGYATREKLGKDIQAQLEKFNRNGNGNGKGSSFDWREWNTKVFPKLIGDPENLDYTPEVIAGAMLLIYDSLPESTNEAISALVEYNLESLKARNGQEKQKASELDELDDLDDLDDDDAIDELMEESEEDEFEIEDELDDEDDFLEDDDDDDEEDDIQY
jgi:hypothetical protein